MRKELVKYLPLYMILAAAVAYFFYYPSPLWNAIGADPSIFSTVGHNWALGHLPYTDTWDSKGPIIFFVNMLGHCLVPGETGIVILQAINTTCVLLLAHYYLRRHCSPKTTLAFNILVLFAYIQICSSGNQVGDTNLLIGAWAVFLAFEWTLRIEDGHYDHPWAYAFVYGLFIASCLLSRLTNGMLISAMIAVVTGVLVWKGLWRNLVANALGFAGGFAAMFLPFALYFAWHGAFGEMWYATFSYNIEYALHAIQTPSAHTAHTLLYFISYNICLITAMLASVLALVQRKHRRTALVWGICSAFTFVMLSRGYQNANYYISFLPVLYIALMEMHALGKTSRACRGALYFAGAYIVVCLINYTRIFPTWITTDEYTKRELQLMRLIPANDSFVAYNADPTIYCHTGRLPCYRFFTFQDWAIENGPSLLPKVRACYLHGHAEWLLVRDPQRCAISDILRRRYKVFRADKRLNIYLYQLRNTKQ